MSRNRVFNVAVAVALAALGLWAWLLYDIYAWLWSGV